MTLDPMSLKLDRSLRTERQMLGCRYAQDGRTLVAAGHDGRLYRWDLATETNVGVDAHRGWVEAIRFLPNGDRLITADSWGQVHAWSWPATDDWKPLWTIDSACASWLRDATVSPDGKWLATCGNEPVVRVFSAVDGKLRHELRGHEQPVYSVTFAPDGENLASGDLHGNVRHWRIDSGECLRTMRAARLFKMYQHYRQGGVRAMAFDFGGTRLYCAGFEGVNANQAQGQPLIESLEWKTGESVLAMTPTESFVGPLLDVAVHPTGFIVATGSSEGGGAVWLWRPDEAKSFLHVKHATSLRKLDLRPDGMGLAAATFGNLDGQRGGNGRRLNDKGEYPDFGGNLALFHWSTMS